MGNTAESSICGPVYNTADVIVSGGWNTFHGFAQDAYTIALEKMNTLGTYTIDETPISISYAFPTGTADFIAPTAPSRIITAFQSPDLPTLPETDTPLFDASLVSARPEAPTDLPTYTPPARPDVSLPTAPDTAVSLEALTLPDAPSYTLPEVPTFISLNLPDPPTFTLPAFEGERPDLDALVAPDNTFDFNEVAYSSALLTQVTERLTTMGQGGTGLPAAVEQALFERARGREEQLAFTEISTALDEWARMGYEEPSGVLNNRVERVRQRAQDKTAGLSRDIYIQAQTVEIENLRFFVTQGVALEQVLIQQHLAVQERALRFAQGVMAVAIDVFNAKIAKENLRTQLYATDAQVMRDRIQGEVARAQLFRTQIDAELAKGEVNEQSIRRYEAQLRSITVLTDIYKTSVEAVVARGQINTQRLEGKRLEVQTYAEQVRAMGSAWEGFKAQVEGELGNVRVTQLATERFATLTSAWQTQNNVATSRLQGELAAEAFKLQRGDQLLRRYLAEIQGESSRLEGDTRILGAEAAVYTAAGQVAQAQSAAQDRDLQRQLATVQADVDAQLKRGEISINATIQRAGLLLESMKSLGNTAAQLAAAAMSAVNLSANLSSSSSNSSSCSQSFDFSGELS